MNNQLSIMEQASTGLPLNHLTVIDAHAHFGLNPQTHSPFGDVAGMLASMDRIGIKLSCISAFQSLGTNYKTGNSLVAGVVKQFSTRFAGYAVINPNYPDDIEAELTRCIDTLQFWGIKLHPAVHRYPPDGEAYHRVYAFMQERQGVVLSHTFGDARILDKLSSQYPAVTFIHAHIGGGYDGRTPFPFTYLLKERANVYVDTVLSIVPFGGIEKLVEQAGADKILFGTDAPFLDNAHQIGRVTHARISEEDKFKILGLNMQLLLAKQPIRNPSPS